MSVKPKNRVYTEQDKIAALAAVDACGGNISRASQMTGIPRKTLDQWAKGTFGVKSIENLPEKKQEAKLELADKLDSIAHALADALPEKIADAKLQNVAVSLGIAIDKRALLRGQPTSITENRSEKARLEVAIAQLIAECASKGMTIDRDEAIRLLEPHLGSEIRKLT